MSVTVETIRQAAKVIEGVADNTPLIPSRYFSGIAGAEVLLKLENMQPIGAFKLRGAMNAMHNLPKGTKGVVCASTGNHGRAVAFAASKLGVRAVICMSELVPETKVQGIAALGGEIRIAGAGQAEADAAVARAVRDEGLVEISAFDHPDVIAGQGTIGLELLAARPDIETLVLPLSGGGLAGGIAVAAKAMKPSIRIIGVTMDRGAAMHLSIPAGRVVEIDEVPSLADSLTGGIGENNQHSLKICAEYIDETHLVTEEEIYKAMQALFFEDRIVAEGACVVGLAAMMSGKLPGLRGPVATTITGRNGDMRLFQTIMNGGDVTLGDYVIKGSAYEAAT